MGQDWFGSGPKRGDGPSKGLNEGSAPAWRVQRDGGGPKAGHAQVVKRGLSVSGSHQWTVLRTRG